MYIFSDVIFPLKAGTVKKFVFFFCFFHREKREAGIYIGA